MQTFESEDKLRYANVHSVPAARRSVLVHGLPERVDWRPFTLVTVWTKLEFLRDRPGVAGMPPETVALIETGLLTSILMSPSVFEVDKSLAWLGVCLGDSATQMVQHKQMNVVDAFFMTDFGTQFEVWNTWLSPAQDTPPLGSYLPRWTVQDILSPSSGA